MNLNQSISFSDLKPGKLLPVLVQYRGWAISLLAAAAIGYTGYQLSLVTSVPPANTAAQSAKNVPSLRFKPATLQKLKSLQNPGDAPIVPIGKQDPFS